MAACWAHILAPSFLVTIPTLTLADNMRATGTLSRNFQDFLHTCQGQISVLHAWYKNQLSPTHSAPNSFAGSYVNGQNLDSYQIATCTSTNVLASLAGCKLSKRFPSYLLPDAIYRESISKTVVFRVTSDRCAVDQVFSASF